ncbi:MAG: hypothetical protein KKE62_11165 [Proteobacteria bacterium]|nr:hypothetical protein [Pseudomonadota bacterium]MBU1389164.1 hypothetical protein [Pseudomonadota bacterium]MBU1543388.1 hypothetical protein [Pseudomonadota bacterium]MBU2482490.1 hypothetical protein [Pseudomonadota bacterium]
MAGINEILVLILIITGIIILPRVFRPQQTSGKRKTSLAQNLKQMSVKIRIAVCLSLIYPFAAALFLKPWTSGLNFFLLTGILPVIIIWSAIWIISGIKNAPK